MKPFQTPQFGWKTVGCVKIPVYSQEEESTKPYENIQIMAIGNIHQTKLKEDLRAFVTPNITEDGLLRRDPSRTRNRTKEWPRCGKPVYEKNVKYYVLKELLLNQCVIWREDSNKVNIKPGAEVEARYLLDTVDALKRELCREFNGRVHNPYFHYRSLRIEDISNADNGDSEEQQINDHEDRDPSEVDFKSDEESIISSNVETTPESVDSSDIGGIRAEMERHIVDDEDISDGTGKRKKKKKKSKKAKSTKKTKTTENNNRTNSNKKTNKANKPKKQKKAMRTQNEIVMKEESSAINHSSNSLGYRSLLHSRDPRPPFGHDTRPTGNVSSFGGHGNVSMFAGGRTKHSSGNTSVNMNSSSFDYQHRNTMGGVRGGNSSGNIRALNNGGYNTAVDNGSNRGALHRGGAALAMRTNSIPGGIGSSTGNVGSVAMVSNNTGISIGGMGRDGRNNNSVNGSQMNRARNSNLHASSRNQDYIRLKKERLDRLINRINYVEDMIYSSLTLIQSLKEEAKSIRDGLYDYDFQ